MYADGWGVPEDDIEAVRLWRLAAEQGFAGAQTNLGIMYVNGDGVPKDDVEALRWFNIAAENGDPKAGSYRDSALMLMSPADISEAQNRARVCMASGYQDCD